MKTLFIDCGMGAAGDMLTAALLELLPDPDEFINRLNSIGIPGVEFKKERVEKCGITGTHMHVKVHGVEEGEEVHEHQYEHEHFHLRFDHAHPHDHDHEDEHEDEHHHEHVHVHTHIREDEHHHEHDHEHDHEHHHGHTHNDLAGIEHIVNDHLNIPQNVKKDVLAVYTLIAEAESHAHGVPVTEIHFHEVGTMDAAADITAVCMLMNEIAPEEVIASPVHVGSGTVKCAHGILPVPAPATAYILQGIPSYGGEIRGELCTPTGAALLKHFVTRFGNMPVMKTAAIGYGMGKKDFPIANCIRVMLGETEDKMDKTVCLAFNVDDMTAEEIGFAMDHLFESGAKEVFTIPVGMKKNRPGTLIEVLCKQEDEEKIVRTIFKHTSTIGVRKTLTDRYVLERKIEERETPYGMIRRKVSSGYGVQRVKYEYDDLVRISNERGISLEDVRKLIDGLD